MTARYDPQAKVSVRAFDVPYARDAQSELLARVYQPEGAGPFPVLLDVHGGAWNTGDRLNNVIFNTAVAESGVLVVAIDFRLAPAHPYPAQIVDQNYATRWLKAHAREFRGDPTVFGCVGSSSGGHTMLLSALRPRDKRYASRPLPEAPGTDATLSYLILLWPVVDPLGRYEFTKSNPEAGTGFGGPETLQERTRAFFLTEDAMKEGNPQLILDRGETVVTPPLYILHPNEDLNVPRPMIERFVESYRRAGGEVFVHYLEHLAHAFIRQPGPGTDMAVSMLKNYIAGRLARAAQPV